MPLDDFEDIVEVKEDKVEVKEKVEEVKETRFQACMQSAKDCWVAVKEVWEEGMKRDDEEERTGTQIWTTIFLMIGTVLFCAIVIAAVVLAIMALVNLLAALASLFAAGKSSTPDTGGKKPLTPDQTISGLKKEIEDMQANNAKLMGDKQKALDDCMEASTPTGEGPEKTISDLRKRIETMKTDHKTTLEQKDKSIDDWLKSTTFCQESFTNQSSRLDTLQDQHSKCGEKVGELAKEKSGLDVKIGIMKNSLNRCILSIPDLSSAGLIAATIMGNSVVTSVSASLYGSASVYSSRYAYSTMPKAVCYV